MYARTNQRRRPACERRTPVVALDGHGADRQNRPRGLQSSSAHRRRREGRELFSTWARAAGCDVRVDAIGNLFARRPGRNESLPAVLTGSHLDTQPTGGKFDGVYGVLAGLEVVESLNDHGISTADPIEIGVWCNEEGCRFPAAMMGSAVWAGRMPLAEAYALTDRNGQSVRQELARFGVTLDAPVRRQPVKAALEATSSRDRSSSRRPVPSASSPAFST